ncbi:hypothetical protein HFN88_33945 [Rhizobium laguerreae]|nr:hypothetical protein [Rhizobium laguerreae]MBY3496737.1 hypothetical protein [Rhizobium laguerreae]
MTLIDQIHDDVDAGLVDATPFVRISPARARSASRNWHRFFTRDGDDIRLELPVPLSEAVLGGKVRVTTPSGPVDLALPPISSSGKVLRIKGKGVPRGNGGAGDVYVTLKIVLPNGPDEELASFMKRR